MPILVDIHAAEGVPVPRVELLLRSCSETAPAICEERSPTSDTPPDAVVEWSGPEYSVVRFWVTGHERTVSRSLRFAERDSIDERVRAAGLLLGALIRDPIPELPNQSEPVAPPPPQAERPPREPEAPAPQSPGLEVRALGSLHFGGVTGWSGRGELAWRPTPAPLAAFAGLSAGWETEAALRVSTVEGEVGALWAFEPLAPVRWEVGAGFVWQEYAVSAESDGRRDRGSRGRPGVAGLGGVVVPVVGPVEVLVRCRTALYPLAPAVLVSGVEALSLRHLEVALQAGVGLGF